MVTNREYRLAWVILIAYGSCITGECTNKTVMSETSKVIFDARRIIQEYEDGQ